MSDKGITEPKKKYKPVPPVETRFKPGMSGNPSGRPGIPKDLRSVKPLSQDSVNRIISKYASMTLAELDKSSTDPNTPAIELIYASAIKAAILDGDTNRLEAILNRGIGKVRDNVAVTTRNESLNEEPTEKLLKLVKEA